MLCHICLKITRLVTRVSLLKDIVQWQMQTRQIKSKQWGKFIKSLFKIWLVLFHWEGYTSFLFFEKGNMSRGMIYCIVLWLLSAIVWAPHSLVTIKATTNFHELFRQWIMIRGYVIYAPKKNNGNRANWKISKIKGETEELTYTIQAPSCCSSCYSRPKEIAQGKCYYIPLSVGKPPQRKLFLEIQVGRIVCDLIYAWQAWRLL